MKETKKFTNNSLQLCSEKTHHCLNLFNNYIKCLSENLYKMFI